MSHHRWDIRCVAAGLRRLSVSTILRKRSATSCWELAGPSWFASSTGPGFSTPLIEWRKRWLRQPGQRLTASRSTVPSTQCPVCLPDTEDIILDQGDRLTSWRRSSPPLPGRGPRCGRDGSEADVARHAHFRNNEARVNMSPATAESSGWTVLCCPSVAAVRRPEHHRYPERARSTRCSRSWCVLQRHSSWPPGHHALAIR